MRCTQHGSPCPTPTEARSRLGQLCPRIWPRFSRRLISMRFAFAFVCILATACGSNSKGPSDGMPADGSDPNNGGSGDGGGSNTGGTTIHVTLTNHPTNAAMFKFLVAFQDGSGAWKLAGAPSGDTYSFNVNSPSWGVVWTCSGTSPVSPTALRQVTEAHFAVAERTSLTMDVPPRCTDTAATVALTGTVSNRSGGGGWVVFFGDKAGLVNPQTGAYRVEATPGTADLVLLHAQSTGNTTGNGADFTATAALVDRGVTVTAAPSPLGGATSQVTGTTPYPILESTRAPYASTIGYAWQALQVPSGQQCGGSACAIIWPALLSPGVTGSAPGYTTPDFSALTGWRSAFAFVTGAMITGYAEAGASSGGAGDFPPVTPPPAGTQRTYVRSAFTVTP